MGVDINNEVMKAGEVMSRYRMSKEHQLEVVKLLIGAGVEHCLQEQQRFAADKEEIVRRAQTGPGIVH